MRDKVSPLATWLFKRVVDGLRDQDIEALFALGYDVWWPSTDKSGRQLVQCPRPSYRIAAEMLDSVGDRVQLLDVQKRHPD